MSFSSLDKNRFKMGFEFSMESKTSTKNLMN